MRRWISCALLLALTLLCWAGGQAALRDHSAQWDMERVSYAYPDGVEFASLGVLRRLIAQDGHGSVTGWAQSLGAKVELEDGSASAEVDAVYLDGDASLAFNPKLVSGQLPALGNDIGCAIDQTTALSLFGSTDVIGKRIKVEGELMEVCGVFEPPGSERGLALCPAARADDELKIAQIEFRLWVEAGKTPVDRARSLLSEAGIDGSGSLNEHESERKLLHWLNELIMALLRFALLIELLRALRGAVRDRVPTKLRALPEIGFWAAVIALLALLPGVGRPPPSMLPSQWSDFTFWPNLLETWRDAASALLLDGVTRLRLTELMSMAAVVALVLLGVILCLLAWRLLRKLVNQQFNQQL